MVSNSINFNKTNNQAWLRYMYLVYYMPWNIYNKSTFLPL